MFGFVHPVEPETGNWEQFPISMATNPRPTSWAPTLAGYLLTAKSEGHAVTQAGVSAPDEQEGNGVCVETGTLLGHCLTRTTCTCRARPACLRSDRWGPLGCKVVDQQFRRDTSLPGGPGIATVRACHGLPPRRVYAHYRSLKL